MCTHLCIFMYTYVHIYGCLKNIPPPCWHSSGPAQNSPAEPRAQPTAQRPPRARIGHSIRRRPAGWTSDPASPPASPLAPHRAPPEGGGAARVHGPVGVRLKAPFTDKPLPNLPLGWFAAMASAMVFLAIVVGNCLFCVTVSFENRLKHELLEPVHLDG